MNIIESVSKNIPEKVLGIFPRLSHTTFDNKLCLCSSHPLILQTYSYIKSFVLSFITSGESIALLTLSPCGCLLLRRLVESKTEITSSLKKQFVCYNKTLW